MSVATRPYRGVPAADRKAARRERLLEAGLEALGTEGYGGTTVRGVCAAAQLGPRYFYESFDDLEGLLVAVFDDVVREMTEQVLAAIDAAPDRDAHAKAHAAIDTFARYLTDDPRRARIAFVEAVGSERLMRRRLDAMRAFSALLAAQAREFYGTADDDAIVDLTAALLVGGMAELLIVWLDGGLGMTRAQLVEDLTELFVATGESAVAIARRRARARA
jgi:AcrR family transcriptional regulator